MKKTMAVRTVGSMIVMRENKETPTDAEWDGFLDQLVKNRANFSNLKILVLTEGGGPNAAQRKRLEQALDGRHLRVAVVTDSGKARFIASAITFLNKLHRGFAVKELPLAYEHLGLTIAEQKLAEAALNEMKPLID